MALLLVSDFGADVAQWRWRLEDCIPGHDIRAWDDMGDPDDIEIILTDTPFSPRRDYRQFSRLRWVHFLGHGAGDVILDPTLPPHVVVTRLVDLDIISGLTEYVVQAITAVHLRVADYREQQAQGLWRRLDVPPTRERRIMVLGLGAIGLRIATVLAALGFEVIGWSQTTKTVAGIRCECGEAALQSSLGISDFVVAVLPETRATRGLLNQHRLTMMKPGAYLINVGRGSVIVEEDMLTALDTGRLSGACLDVFAEEPLPAESPLWRHPLIRVTPHTGGARGNDDQYRAFRENYLRFRAGDALFNSVERTKGY